MMPFKCKECNQDFPSERSLHTHLKKHKMSLADYYCAHYPKKNLLTGTKLSFKDKESYFEKDFENREQLLKWCNFEKAEVVKPYIKQLLERRVANKELVVAPSHIEIETSELPSIDCFKKHYGSYSAVCSEIGIKPMFAKNIHKDFYSDYSNVNIFIDTREQQPLQFQNQREVKLDFGDYTAGGQNYSKTFVDRKSEGDFKSTLVGENFDRFKREIERCKSMDCFLFIVVESSFDQIKNNNDFTSHKSNLKFVYHNMRLLQQEFHKNCQFVFSGSRKNSVALIPKLLVCGPKLWETDIQYFIEKDQSWLGSLATKKEKAFTTVTK
jgi:hypothetical protein